MISAFRRLAQTARHTRGLRLMNPLWNILHKPYLQILTALGSKNGIEVVVGDYPMRVHPAFATVSWETVEVKSYGAFARAVQADDVIYDVGAHIGTYTMTALLKAGFRGKVVAYEPCNLTREYLLQHLKWNGVAERAIVRDLCCGAISGTADFYCLPGRAEGMNGLVPVDGFEKVRVEVTTLDAEIARLELNPSIIKIDVEGAEWDVLKGAEQALRQYRPVLFLSFHPDALAKRDESVEAILDWLRRLGYRHEEIGRDHEIHVIAGCQVQA